MIEDSVTKGCDYFETSENIHYLTKKDHKIFFTIIFINKKTVKEYTYVLISLTVFSLLLKLATTETRNLTMNFQ